MCGIIFEKAKGGGKAVNGTGVYSDVYIVFDKVNYYRSETSLVEGELAKETVNYDAKAKACVPT